jgi:hypothetical protein
MLRHSSTRIGLAVAALSLAGLGVAPQANASGQVQVPAAEVEAESSAGRVADAPPCIYRFFEEHWYAFHVHGRNDCSGRRYVKVIVAFGPDSACMGVDRGQSFTHSFQIGRFDRVDYC